MDQHAMSSTPASVPASTTPASWKEMMAVFLARQIRDTDRIC